MRRPWLFYSQLAFTIGVCTFLIVPVIMSMMAGVTENFFLGIRTPWTLASDEVWSQTHRLGGRVFVLIGFFMFVNAFFRFPESWLFGSIVVLALVPVIYSYVLYRKIEGFAPDNTADDGTQ